MKQSHPYFFNLAAYYIQSSVYFKHCARESEECSTQTKSDILAPYAAMVQEQKKASSTAKDGQLQQEEAVGRSVIVLS